VGCDCNALEAKIGVSVAVLRTRLLSESVHLLRWICRRDMDVICVLSLISYLPVKESPCLKTSPSSSLMPNWPGLESVRNPTLLWLCHNISREESNIRLGLQLVFSLLARVFDESLSVRGWKLKVWYSRCDGWFWVWKPNDLVERGIAAQEAEKYCGEKTKVGSKTWRSFGNNPRWIYIALFAIN